MLSDDRSLRKINQYLHVIIGDGGVNVIISGNFVLVSVFTSVEQFIFFFRFTLAFHRFYKIPADCRDPLQMCLKDAALALPPLL